eukprot:6613488-Pyramimonas_sp.AAC.1
MRPLRGPLQGPRQVGGGAVPRDACCCAGGRRLAPPDDHGRRGVLQRVWCKGERGRGGPAGDE